MTMWMGGRQQYPGIVAMLQSAFRQLEALVPPPQGVTILDEKAPRYIEQLPQQALIIKLARVVSGLRALDILLSAGCYQEQASLQRVIDDAGEDIDFIGFALMNKTWSKDHDRYMAEFWDVGVQPDGTSVVRQSRPLRRDKIRAFVLRSATVPDPHGAGQSGRILYQTYSGFIHATAESAMDMVRGDPPHFVIDGQHSEQRVFDYTRDAGNYFYRGLLSALMVAMVLNDWGLAGHLRSTIEMVGPP